QGSVLAPNRAGAATVGAGLLGAQPLGLLFDQGGEGSFGEASGSRRSDLLHRVQIDIGAWAGVAESVAGNDLAPAGSQSTDLLEVFSGELTTWHGQPCLGVTRIGADALLLPLYGTALWLAKRFLTSPTDGTATDLVRGRGAGASCQPRPQPPAPGRSWTDPPCSRVSRWPSLTPPW